MKKLANVASKTSRLPAGIAVESEEAVFSRQRVLAAIGMAQAAMARKYAYTDQAITAMPHATTRCSWSCASMPLSSSK